MASFSFSVVMALAALSAVNARATERRTEHFRVMGYEPDTQVTDHAALDLDQMVINQQVSKRKNNNAKHVYEYGGHSFSYAELTLKNLDSAQSFEAGTDVMGNSRVSGGDQEVEVIGMLMEPVSWKAGEQEVQVQVKYVTSDIQDDYVDCQVGGLHYFGEANLHGCFAKNGTIQFFNEDESTVDVEYYYSNRKDNKNLRTLKSLSADAETMMKGADGLYQPDYLIFKEYYGDYDYGDKWIMAASAGVPTKFSEKRGNADFTQIKEHRPGRGEAMKKGAAYLNVWMWVVKEMHDAVAQCKNGSESASHSIDKAVAFYAGSLAVTEQNEGIMLYALANVRAHQFKTAGHSGDQDEGEAYVNIEVSRALKKAQSVLKSDAADRCEQAEESVKSAINFMKVPLVQGILRYAYVRDNELPPGDQDKERAKAEGATFAAAVLPYIHKCSIQNANTIHEHMRVGESDDKINFKTVKQALEQTYSCLGITCEDVGGVWDGGLQEYKKDANPCEGDGSSGSQSQGINANDGNMNTGSTIGAILGVTIGVLLLGWLFLRYRHMGKGLGRNFRSKRKMSNHQMAYNGNIAAVTEIA